MSAAAPVLAPVKYSVLAGAATAEQKYWRSYKSPLIIKDYAPITHISFCTASPFDFCIASASRVQIFSSKTRSLIKTVSRFKETVNTAHIRSDGKLLLAGDEGGLVQVFDMGSRNILKSCTHRLAVQASSWSPTSLTDYVTASDDTTVKLWDLTSPEPVHTFEGHTDYVRSAAMTPDGSIVSGGYDGLVRMWDTRTRDAVLTFDTESPVECILLKDGHIASGGADLRLWDIVAGRKRRQVKAHQKTITSLCTDGEGRRVISGGLDGLIKVYDDNWKVVHGVKYGGPVLAVAVCPDDRHLLASTSTGILSIRSRATPRPNQAKKPKSASQRRKLHGMEYRGEQEEYIVEEVRRRRLKPVEKDLLAYRFGDALERVLRPGTQTLSTVTLFNELKHRSALRQALLNRDENTIQTLALFLTRHLSNPQYAAIITEVAFHLIDLHAASLTQSKALKRLQQRVGSEIQRAKDANKMQGMLDMYLAAQAKPVDIDVL